MLSGSEKRMNVKEVIRTELRRRRIKRIRGGLGKA